MPENPMLLNMDAERLIPALQEARQKLDQSDGEFVLDFSAVRRVDSAALKALEELAGAADNKSVKVTLRGVNVDVYKVLKLVKLSPRFVFLN